MNFYSNIDPQNQKQAAAKDYFDDDFARDEQSTFINDSTRA